MKILIGADFVPTPSNYSKFADGNIEYLFGNEILEADSKSDISIFNLELPITDSENRIIKNGPALKCPTSVIDGIKKFSPTVFSIANNHILDYGEKGLADTIDILQENGIAITGAGKNGEEASKPFIFKQDGKTLGIYSCVEHEFSITSEEKAGANPFDPLYSFDAVSELKQSCDYVIVLYHGGKEHYRYPSPELQRVCRRFAEKGADAVICQHSHCIGCYENYNGSHIVYGQGNFIFDDASTVKNEAWKTGILISLDIISNEISYIPVYRNGNNVRMAKDSCAEEILNKFNERTEKIKENGYVKEKYDEFSDEMLNKYFRDFTWRVGPTFVGKVLNKIFKLANVTLGKKDMLRLQNFVECESHRELLLNGLKRKLKSKTDNK